MFTHKKTTLENGKIGLNWRANTGRYIIDKYDEFDTEQELNQFIENNGRQTLLQFYEVFLRKLSNLTEPGNDILDKAERALDYFLLKNSKDAIKTYFPKLYPEIKTLIPPAHPGLMSDLETMMDFVKIY